MRCKICDSVLSNPQFNERWDEYDPCGTCLEVIDNVFEDYVEEDEERDEEKEND